MQATGGNNTGGSEGWMEYLKNLWGSSDQKDAKLSSPNKPSPPPFRPPGSELQSPFRPPGSEWDSYSTMNLKEFNFDMPSILYRGTMPYEIKRNPKLIEDLKAKHIANIILLCDDKECQSATSLDLKTFYKEQGFNVLQFAIPDFQAPDAEKLRELIETIQSLLKTNDKDHNTLIHCKGGKGRTGMIIACLARRIFNFSSEQAVAWVRKTVPGSVEMPVQHDAIKKFAPEPPLGPPPAFPPPPPPPVKDKQDDILKDAPLAPSPAYPAPPPPVKEKEPESNHLKRSAASLSDSSSVSASESSHVSDYELFDADENFDANKSKEESS